jgi:signal transduction histidine kinase
MTQPEHPLVEDGLRPDTHEAGDQAMAALTQLHQPTREEVLEEVRQLVTDLRDATQDGRILAKRYADVLQNVVDEYCLEFEKRAEAALEKLENFK